MRTAIFFLLLIPMLLLASPEKKAPSWSQPLDYFIGSWQGKGEGMGGISIAERHYEWILQHRFVQHKNKSEFKPQEKNPKGEIHEDMGVFGYDEIRGKIVFRQFHVEGYVNQYIVTFSEDGKSVTMDSEAIENLPTGFRVRYRITIQDENHFEESFELAGPGKEFACFSTNRFERIR